MKPTLLLTLLLPLLAGESSIEDPVTYLGEHILAKTDLVAKGTVSEMSRLPNGTRIVHFTITEVIRGREASSKILLVTASTDLVPEKDVPSILFLKRLGKARYDPVGRVDVTGTDAKDRVGTLRRYIEIEAIADGKEKRAKLRDYLLENLESKKSFLVWSAARELANFTKKNAKYLSDRDRERVRKVRAAQTDAILKELLDTALRNLGITPPDEEAAKKEIEGPAGPEFREVRRLIAAWARMPESPATRKALLTELTSKYLKYSGRTLLKALNDSDAAVRRHAAIYLGEGEFDDAVDPLRKRLEKERDVEVRSAVIHSLGILKSEKALPRILALGKQPKLRRTVAFAAARIGGKLAEEWLDTLLAAHNSESEEDLEIRKLVKFLRSEAFRKQEKAMAEIRQKRLK